MGHCMGCNKKIHVYNWNHHWKSVQEMTLLVISIVCNKDSPVKHGNNILSHKIIQGLQRDIPRLFCSYFNRGMLMW